MAEGKARESWGHTANLIFWLSEVRRSCGNFKKAPHPLAWKDVYPFAPEGKPIQVPITALRDVFCRKQKK